MATEVDPIVGNWYRDLDNDEAFEVIAVDEDEGVVEVQRYDGNLESYDMDEWYALDIELAEPPEEWEEELEASAEVEDEDEEFHEDDEESEGEDWDDRSEREYD